MHYLRFALIYSGPSIYLSEAKTKANTKTDTGMIKTDTEVDRGEMMGRGIS